MDDVKASDGAATAAWAMGGMSSTAWAVDPTNESMANASTSPQPAAASVLGLAGTTTPTLADTITLHLSEDAWQEDAQVLISVDGTPLDGVQTITASHALGLSQNLTFLGDFGAGPHTVSVQFLNDAWDGTAGKDRNLYVDGIVFDGTPVKGAAAILWSSSTWTHALPAASTSVTSVPLTADLAAERTLPAVSDAVPAVNLSSGTASADQQVANGPTPTAAATARLPLSFVAPDRLAALNVPDVSAGSKILQRGSAVTADAPSEGQPAQNGTLTLVPVQRPQLFVPGNAGPGGAASAATPAVGVPGAAAPLAAAGAAQNAIVLENQKPGNPQSEWDLSGPGSSSIEGFTTDISSNEGQTVSFKINTVSNNYRVDIYRLGYYGGMGARKVATLQHQAATGTNQPSPIVDPNTGEVDAGNWSATDSWAVPADAVSGVYIAKLVRQDGTAGANQIPFIVRNDASHSDIVFQTSDETWQAYNGWGGANLYGGNGPGGDSAFGRAFKVSYNRPIGTRDGIGLYSGPQDYVFGAEYSGLRWMEQNGYDVSYIAGLDASRSGSLLLNHKIFTSTGHDEYWTGDQRANVNAARDAGVNLAFMSGNEVYWKTRLEPSLDSSKTPNRTLVTYKETRAGDKIDPSTEWTGTWRDPTFSPPANGGKAENATTGTEFEVDSYRADSITIPYGETLLRLWRNTAVAQTQPNQTASLVQNYLGYEWDISPNNGSRPAGLINLSSTTLGVSTYLLDYGTKTGSNTATHNLTLYRAASGALVFGAGTVFWSWGLDSNHDLTPTPTDPNVQQAMVNLFADMGVQPQSLQASFQLATQSSDHTAPVSTISTASGTSVAEGTVLTITGKASDVGGVVGGVEVSADGGTTWNPAGGTAANWTYAWTALAPGAYTIKSRGVDDSLNLEAPGAGVSINVTAASSISLFQPGDTPDIASDPDAKAAELGMKFTASQSGTITGILFYKGSGNTGTHIGNLWSSTGTLLATTNFTGETASGWQRVNFTSPVQVAAGATYVASYHTNAGHYSDTPNYFVVPHSSGTLTASASAAPNAPNGLFASSAASVFPTGGLEAATNYWVDVVFNPASQTSNQPPVANNDSGFTATKNTPLTIPASALLANDTDPNGDPLSITSVSSPTNGTATYNATTQNVTFTPTTGYTGAAGFTYAITDGRGGAASANAALTVNTAPTTASLFQASDTPATLSDADASAVELGVRFQASAAGTITGLRFYKGAQNTGTHIADLWSASGTLLASATFAGETASGWQQVSFSSPVALTAGTTYVAAYHTNTGHYSDTAGYFTTAHSSGALTAPASGNGVYNYGASDSFPTNTYNATNYWVDVVFNPASQTSNQPPVANNDSGFTATKNTPLTIPASALLANDTDPNGDPLSITSVSSPTNGTATYNATTQNVTFTPTTGYTGAAGFTYAITDGRGGAASANAALTVNTAPTTASLFQASDTPAFITDSDTSSVELGVKFTPASNGTITGLGFYKGPLNTGTHTGHLWDPAGAVLAAITYAGETASGWQWMNLATPVPVASGTTYVASYHTNVGYYSADANYFSTAHVSGPLTAPAAATSANGVYAYGSGSPFPTSTYNATNYWTDVRFQSA